MAGNNESILIITGMSGAGKSQVTAALEDLGYFCVDNLPPSLFASFIRYNRQTRGELSKMAVIIDVRGGEDFYSFEQVLAGLANEGIKFRILFMEASEAVLVSRYKETRRRHPLARSGRSVSDCIVEERQRLTEMRGLADIVIDTSDLSNRQLSAMIVKMFSENESEIFTISVSSFGFKYGMPIDADMVIDVRFLPNPYYIEEMRYQTGLDTSVRDYVLDKQETTEFLNLYLSLLKFLLPNYIKEGKKHLAIAVGCTGGRHRSVTIAEAIATSLVSDGYETSLSHRDIKKGNKTGR